VFFRDFIREHAERLGLTGYVQNLPNGSVEVGAEGEKDKLEQLARYLKIGPPAATVDRVITEWSEYKASYSDFRIRY
jgi:acylphosphatase